MSRRDPARYSAGSTVPASRAEMPAFICWLSSAPAESGETPSVFVAGVSRLSRNVMS